MEFKKRFKVLSDEIKDKEGEERIPISNDAYCVGEMIEKLINKIEQSRIAFLTRRR